jgi:hypothetical protein
MKNCVPQVKSRTTEDARSDELSEVALPWTSFGEASKEALWHITDSVCYAYI